MMILHRTQSGAALLAFMLIIITGASFILVSSLNSNVRQYSRQAGTAATLQDARAALLSYSVTYPENHISGGPGILPCPDLNNNGSASGNCSFPDTTLGRFPWKTVGVGEFRDHHGEHLWYAISDNFRTPQVTQINSDTPGTLGVDGMDDIVAVIFAPGAPVESQDRVAGPLLAANYLEGGNEVNDNTFTSRSAGEFNDQLVYITRRELMEVVEKRVLGDVVQALSAYQSAGWNTDTAFPWLSPFADPAVSAFRGQAGMIQGHVPFHWAGDTSGVAGRNPFATDYFLSWNSVMDADIDRDSATDAWFTLPAATESCARNSLCNDASDSFNGLVPDNTMIAAASCLWSDRLTLGCPPASYSYDKVHTVWSTANIYGYKNNTGTGWIPFYTDTSGGWKWDWAYFNSGAGAWGWGTYSIDRVVQGNLTREYAFDITLTGATDININPPAAASPRTRDIEITGTLSPSSIELTITDTLSGIIQYPDYGISSLQSQTTLASDNDTTGTIAAAGITYDIDIDDGELPAWFVQNGWHELIYIAYASGEGSPPGTAACSPSVDCIALEGIGGTNDDKRAIVLIAGQELPGQQRSASPDSNDYFEGENITADDQFRKDKSPVFNDQLRILAEVVP